MKKESQNSVLLTNLTKKLSFSVDRDNFIYVLDQENNSFNESIKKKVLKEDVIINNPSNERELTLYILLALYLYKQKEYSESRSMMQLVLFEQPWLMYQRASMNQLSDYLYYKYLNSIEFSN